MPHSLTHQLSDTLARPVAAGDRRRAVRHLLDWLGCALAGAAEPAGRILRDYAAGANGPATVIGGGSGPAELAALANGGLGNVLEMDDVHKLALLHPGPVVVPAALALAQELGACSNDLLDAVVRGYEAMIRIGRAAGPGHYALWHPTSTCGPFGAAAAAASLLGLDRDASVAALGNAGTQASGPWRCRHEDVMSKQLHTARAAQSGLLAARLARLGFTGPAFILEGEQGLFAATAPDPRPEQLNADPHGAWQIHAVSFKPWPACRHAHAAIDAALQLHDDGISADRVEKLTVHSYADAVRFCDNPDPRTSSEAKFSLQHAVALALGGGVPALELDAFRPGSVLFAQAGALRAKATVAVAPDYDRAYPRRFGAAVVAQLADGTSCRAEIPDALGDPENPLSVDRLTAKTRQLLAAGGLAPAAAERLIDAVWSLTDGLPLETLTTLLASIKPDHDKYLAKA